jgi:hypothetical protein
MTATDALVPIHEFLPLPISRDMRPWTLLQHPPEGSSGRLLYETYTPEVPIAAYGPDGKEITFQKTGKVIDYYI